jgi:hypothetical protein
MADNLRGSMQLDTVRNHLLVCLNGCGTAHYDPRPAVSAFLNRRERRYQNPDLKTYSGREFSKKFFRADGLL